MDPLALPNKFFHGDKALAEPLPAVERSTCPSCPALQDELKLSTCR
jgi:hypothetical protein